MQVSIGQIADLFSGIYVNAAASRGAAVYYLQLRHWNKARGWSNFIQPELYEENRLIKNYLEIGDVLLATKGMDNFAVVYDGLYAPAIASSVFTVLRIKNKASILPVYLQWYLNHPATIQILGAAAKGTSTQLITRDVVEQLVLPLPSLEKQRAIINLQDLQQRATQLRRQIDELSKKIFDHNLLQQAYKQ